MGIYKSECHASHGLSERFTTLEVKRGSKGTKYLLATQVPDRVRECDTSLSEADLPEG